MVSVGSNVCFVVVLSLLACGSGSNFSASFPLPTDDVCRLTEGSVCLHKTCSRRRNVKEIKQNERVWRGGGGGGGGKPNWDFVNIYVNKMEGNIRQCNILALA